MSTTDRDLAQLLGLAGARPPLPEERAQRIRAAVLPAWLKESRSYRRRRIRGVVAVAVAAGLAVAAALMLWSRSLPELGAQVAVAVRLNGPEPRIDSPDGSVGALSTGATVRVGHRITAEAGLAALQLNDGALLRIDAGTEVSFVSEDLLEVDRGAIYIDSGTDGGSDEGISIRTPLGTVHEIGTQFEVRVAADAVRVRVREGRVELEGPETSARGEAHDELLLRSDGTLERRTVRAYGSEWEWIQRVAPAFELDGRTLGDFLRWVSRETGWAVRYSDPTVGVSAEGILIRGPETSVSPRDVLPLVLAACELSYRLEDGVLTIGAFDPSQVTLNSEDSGGEG